MNLRQLEAFRAVMRTGSITAGAGLLNISQPSVSRLIADLEANLGMLFFQRTSRGLVATVEARTFYRGVEGMFIDLDRLAELADSIRTTSGGIISVGSIPSIINTELPKAVKTLYDKYSDVHFMIHSRNTPAILEGVQLNQFDLGVVTRKSPHNGVEVLYEVRAPYVCLMPEEHPLIGQEGAVDLEELVKTENFVTFGGTIPDDILSLDPELSKKMRRTSRLSTPNLPVAGALVRATGALAIADPFSAEQTVLMGGVAYRPIKQKLNYHLALVASSRENLSKRTLEFVDTFIEVLKKRMEVIRQHTG